MEGIRQRIFISYRRQDSAPYAGRLYDALGAHFGAAQVFMDVETTEIGADYERVIVDTIATADVVLGIVGPHWLTATDDEGRRRIDRPEDFVRRELELALGGRARVIPVLVDDADVPAAAELPASLAGFTRRQALIMSDRRWRADVAELIAALGGGPASTVPDRPPARVVAPRRSSVGALPFHRTRFIGRDDDAERIRGLLSSTGFVTIVGPGGVGKSRLAVETARTIENRYEDGACLAELASLDDPSLIVQALSRATDAAMDERDQSVESLIRNLADRQLLLLLDNCEHLIEDVAAVTEALVQHCPRLHVLATSREPLQVEGEALCRLAPLTTPTPEAGITAAELAGSAAAVLFADRAALAEPSFVLDDRAAGAVADIVVALDGLPLALELAAASLRSVGLDAVVAGLSQPVPPLADRRTSQTRQRTMWATVDWSYQLLDDDLRLLLERLSVFAGSFTAAQAEAVCASGREPASVAPTLAELADRSLVDHAMASRDDDRAGRYRVLNTVRDYARERLGGRPDDPTGRCLQRWAADTARVHGRAVDDGDELAGLAVLDADHPNLLAALTIAMDASDGAVVGDIASSLAPYWELRGLRAEGLVWAETALGLPLDDGSLRARCCLAAERLTVSGDFDARRRRAVEALDTADRAGDDATAGAALATLAHIDLETEHLEAARPNLDAALVRARRADDHGLVAVVLLRLADCRRDELGQERFEALVAEANALYVERGNRRGQLWCLAELGFARAVANDLDPATAAFDQGLQLARELGYPQGEAWIRDALGETTGAAGQFDRSRAHFEEAEAIQVRLGDELNRGWSLGGLVRAAVGIGDVGLAIHWLAEFGRALRGDVATLYEYAFLLRAGSVAVLSGRLELAGRILGCLDARDAPASRSPTDRDDHRAVATSVAATLDPTSLAEARRRGALADPLDLGREVLDAGATPT